MGARSRKDQWVKNNKIKKFANIESLGVKEGRHGGERLERGGNRESSM